MIVRATWIGTAVFALTAAVAAVTDATPAEAVSTAVALLLFLVGCVAFVAAYARAVARSRTDDIQVAGLYLLMGNSAPPEIRRLLLGALGLQIVVALGTAAARPYSPLAFGILVPTYGLGLAGLWAARHGTFPARPQQTRQTRQKAHR